MAEFRIDISIQKSTFHVMKFLITNDDGFDAPGLAALYQALLPLGDVTVVAPATCHSSKGHAVDTKNPIKLERRNVAPFGQIFVAHCSPADCIRVGLCHVMKERPDFVVAGINPGANLGVDLFYSGTAAAAREATLLGVPSIAVSRLISSEFPIDWEILGRHTSKVLRTLLRDEYRLPGGQFWNVNFPTVADEKYPDELTFVPHGTLPHSVAFQVVEDRPDSQLLAYSGVYRERPRSPESDVHLLFEQRLTATPVGPSLTFDAWNRLHSIVSLADATCAD
jgi:5'-nucleotidase